MPEREITLTTVATLLDGEAVLARVLSIPGVSMLGATDAKIETGLEKRASQYLRELPVAELHQHGGEMEPSVMEIQVTLPPPKRHANWSEEVILNFPVAYWKHGTGTTLARVPSLDLTVLIEDAETLEKRITEEIRFALQRTKISTSLWRLANAQRAREVRVDRIVVKLPVKTPKQAAQDEDKEDAKKESPLTGVATDLIKESFEPAVELDETLHLLADTLGGRQPQSVLLIGASGVGKTAAFHELVRRRADFHFAHTPFWATSGARLVAGMTGFGMWQERCGEVVREAAKVKAILHLGNLVELMSVGKSTHNQQGIASFLRPHIARGELLAVVECTPEQLAAVEREDPHLLNVFAQIRIEPASAEKARRILKAVSAQKSDVSISDEALDELVRLHTRYATYSASPGRPLRFLKNLLQDRLRTRSNETAPPATAITPQDITAEFSRETGLPLFMLDDAEPLELTTAREWFSARVIGQSEAVETISDLLATVKTRLARPRKPLASLLFIGPTGVGKTELAKSLAQFLFGSADRMVRFDMSEFADPLAAQRLIAGTSEGEGLLTARVREQPFCVLLLDEFEKADPAVFDLLLQVLGEGRLTDATGRVADFCNAAIILTSNLGAQNFQRGAAGFADARQQSDAREHFVGEVKKFLRPEMFNRIDAIVPFAPLDQKTVLSIARREIALVRQRDGIRSRNVELRITEAAVEHLASRGFDARYGARPLKRAIERDLLAPLADALNSYVSPDEVLIANVAVDQVSLVVNVRARAGSDAKEENQAKFAAATLCLQLRRKIQRMRASAAVTAIENAVAHLNAIKQKPAAKTARNVRQSAPLERLPKLEQLLREVADLEQRAIEFETDLLTLVYEKAPVDGAAAEVRRLGILDELELVARRVFTAQFDRPDDITLCVFGEDHEWVLRLAQAYWEIAASPVGKVARAPELQLRQIVASRAGRREDAAAVVLKDVPKPTEFFAARHEDLLGVILGVNSPLAWPRFEAETGEHVFKTDKAKQRAIVEASPMAFEDYKPPKGMERPGFKADDQCRAFNDSKRTVKDQACGSVAWDDGFTPTMRRLIETRLKTRIHATLNIES